jgi:hypothetical protein
MDSRDMSVLFSILEQMVNNHCKRSFIRYNLKAMSLTLIEAVDGVTDKTTTMTPIRYYVLGLTTVQVIATLDSVDRKRH